MMNYVYSTGLGKCISDNNILGFLDRVYEGISIWGTYRRRKGKRIIVDFGGVLQIRGEPLSSLPHACKWTDGFGLPLPSKSITQVWNELIFSLYPDDSIADALDDGEIQVAGISYPKQRLYGGDLLIQDQSRTIELGISLLDTEIQFQVYDDIRLGLQSLLAIVSSLERTGITNSLSSWRLLLKPVMFYQEMYNGREENS